MTHRAGHVVDDGVLVDGSAPPRLAAGLDAERAERNTVAWGGDATRWRHVLTAALAVQRSSSRPEQGHRDLSALAAWRSGVVGLRADALARLDRVLGGGGDDELPSPEAAAAALGLDAARLDAFAEGQRTDPFAWPPGRPGGLIARVGGFRGLGGPWQARPQWTTPLDEAGAHLLWVAPEPGVDGPPEGSQLWRLDADVFGHSLVLIADDVPAGLAIPDGGGRRGTVAQARSSVLLRWTSCLAFLVEAS
ncbi:potassium transporter Kef [Frigoribacterium sp. ACAM 257]|uniref:potassium transporter Kef n=1 Tax=Frigoribacterium sp. ACAM 257 TaxID=2508998 RepID=UPI0011BA3857|nr:potassium transporter Kef [Frigoribacterium sp. ACAM 257]TWX40895.1 potassium transporter Kef [Frigoribacterium sp. ACAM 257]